MESTEMIRTPNYDHWADFGIPGPLRHYRVIDVKHDLQLVRKILIAIRDKEDLEAEPVCIEGYDPVLVARHVQRLLHAGIIEGFDREVFGAGIEAPMILVTDLSLEGQALLGSLEAEHVWGRFAEALSPAELASLSMAQIKEIAIELAGRWARKKLGLE